ncbi:hypothetical protein [Streptomyces colonosanans]|uniref:hypothetical protein n=1 Tax=Streptomyces colonosanans TaxID=1428652 RepID=UPI00115FBEE6|nr:hypothetical protein [Streptomyces colonosanans]
MRSQQEKRKPWKKRAASVALLVGVTACIGVVSYLIATEPPKGASSLKALRDAVQRDVARKDTDAFQDLFDDDTVGDEYAEGYLAQLGAQPPQLAAAVETSRGRHFIVLRSVLDRSVCTAWHVKEKDGRQLLDGVPPAEPLCRG